MSQSVVMSTFVDLDIVGDRLRLHDGIGTINWGGFDWLGLGQYGGIDAISESLEVIAQPFKLTLSGVDSQYIIDAMSANYAGRDAVVYTGVFNPDTKVLIDTPEEARSGFMDWMQIEMDHNLAVITVNCENRLRRAPGSARYTDEDQRSLYSTDVFFNHLHEIPGFIGKWGSQNVGGGGGNGRGGPSPRDRRQPV